MQVKNRMTQDVYTTGASSALNEVWDLMEKLRVRHMPVLENNRLVGIISDRDVLIRATKLHGKLIVPNIPVREVMTKNVITCHSRTQVGQVAALMLENRIDSVPVVDGGLLVGLITSSDMLEILCSSDSSSAHQVIPIKFQMHYYPRADVDNTNIV